MPAVPGVGTQTFGSVPGVANANSTFGGALQGGGTYNNSTIQVPQAPGQVLGATTLGSVPSVPDFTKPLTATAPGTTTTTTPGPKYYNGQVYTDPTAYANAVIADAQTSHDANVKQINAAYQNGLITYQQQKDLIDQNRTTLSTQLGQNLDTLKQNNQGSQDSNTGYFNSISPDATQSQQGVYSGKINDATATATANAQTDFGNANKSLDTQATNLGTAQQGFQQNYQNQLQTADQNLLSAKDAALNGTLPQTSSTGGSSSQIDPATLVQNIALSAIGANSAGLSPAQSQQAVTAQLAGQGLNPAQIAPYIQYVYGGGGQPGIINDPNNSYGNAYAKKSSQLLAPAG